MLNMPQDVAETPGPDVEKQVALQNEAEDTRTSSAQQSPLVVSAVDPAIEARVLRKLDWRVPTLLAFLCTKKSRLVVDA